MQTPLPPRAARAPGPQRAATASHLRTGLLACAFGLAVMGLAPSIASAHVVTAQISCTGVEFDAIYFADVPGNVIHESVTVDGAPPITFTFTFNGPSGSNSLPLSLAPGPHTIAVHADFTGGDGFAGSYDASRGVNCSTNLCTVVGSISAGFNGTGIVGVGSGPAYVWLNGNISLKNLPAGSSVTLTGSQVVINGTPYSVPNANITFAAVSCASTSYDAGSNTWNTTVPLAGSDEIFLSGAAIPVSSLPGGAKVTWSGTFTCSQPGVCLQWKWGAAAYKFWPLAGATPDYNAAQIKPAHDGTCGINNGDHAGTPQSLAVRQSVTGGATGGGGSNFTGSWSSTGSTCPVCPPGRTDMASQASGPQTSSGAAGFGLEALAIASRPSPASGPVDFSLNVPSRSAGNASLRILDAAGRSIASFDLSGRTGNFSIHWDGADRAGHTARAGVYFAILTAGEERVQRTIVIR